jgi:hypothetical protein
MGTFFHRKMTMDRTDGQASTDVRSRDDPVLGFRFLTQTVIMAEDEPGAPYPEEDLRLICTPRAGEDTFWDRYKAFEAGRGHNEAQRRPNEEQSRSSSTLPQKRPVSLLVTLT